MTNFENVVNISTREEQTDFGKVWYVNSSDGAFRFAIYRYDDDIETVYLSNVFVSKAKRGQGYGNIILNATDNIAREMDAKSICLKVKKDSFVHEWYTRHGYTDIEIDTDDTSYEWMKKDV